MGRPANISITFRRSTRDVPPLSAEDNPRFWNQVQKQENNCWIWTGAVGYNGYGSFYMRKPNPGAYRAHRITWTEAHGRTPSGFDLDHVVCRNPLCVNPDHLELTTPRVNYWRRDGRYWARDMETLLFKVMTAEGDIDRDTFTSAAARDLLGLSQNRMAEACNMGELSAYKGPSVTKGFHREQWYIPRNALYVFLLNRGAEDSGLNVVRALIEQKTGERLSLTETLACAARMGRPQ
ncbi:HNH endonuclease signature motif containing protein [Mycobacteroides abscessus]|uniref:HNH endonuclease signature motif containing protein n=1 Tax=Mycobacteroides abscessus TaxID=36809 RepID=UPI0009D27844|nr:HNH endonuclease signature motif containing protein [Mycobacteroides abscessus]MBE5447537.1 hypothetical protein [Mycobacteroides abscessus]MBE5514158.1 hypothetical protein [Mycobacteroides abscessus]MDM2138101.1 HNH endonuclease signature motif containing protein [Mycobacteroides abscessus]MDM2158016.1 HNH endonuclease signature motif containing protein [Mycobacteroides abscessus]MDM2192607.1 HNH endonuclease signature motif containing protein [Mycobacteroides abscessus]